MHRNSKYYKNRQNCYQILVVKITVYYRKSKLHRIYEYIYIRITFMNFIKLDKIEQLYKMNSRPLSSTNNNSIEKRLGLSVSFPIYNGLIIFK